MPATKAWADRVVARCCDFLDYDAAEPFDLIVSNPPFFGPGLEAPDGRRAAARHDSALPPDAFMRRAAALLAPEGRVCVILPADRETQWSASAALAGLYLLEAIDLKTKPTAPVKRVILTYAASAPGLARRSLLLLNSPDYSELTAPFYL